MKTVKLDDRLKVEDVSLDECANCGEQFLDPEAVRHISGARHQRRGK